MSVWAIISRQRKALSTRLGYSVDSGQMHGHRWEWGVGKGRWKRALKKDAQALGCAGHCRAIYFVVGSYYTFKYTGTGRAINALYEAY